MFPGKEHYLEPTVITLESVGTGYAMFPGKEHYLEPTVITLECVATGYALFLGNEHYLEPTVITLECLTTEYAYSGSISAEILQSGGATGVQNPSGNFQVQKY